MENKLNLTPEQLEQAKTANSAAALLSLAQENGIGMTNEQAAEYYAELHAQVGVLSDDEMDSVSGGLSNAGGKGFTLLVEGILESFCFSCQYYKASRKPTVYSAMVNSCLVCKCCPNLGVFNSIAGYRGFKGFRRDDH